MTILSHHLNPDLICCDLSSSGKTGILAELGELLSKTAPTPDAKAITAALADRERLATTGVGDGAAIPHAKMEGLDRHRIAVGISRAGVAFDAVDDKPVHIFFALIAPVSSAGEHLRILAQISRLLKNADVRKHIVRTRSPKELIELISAETEEP